MIVRSVFDYTNSQRLNPIYFYFAFDDKNHLVIKFSYHHQWPLWSLRGTILPRKLEIKAGYFQQQYQIGMDNTGQEYRYDFLDRPMNDEEIKEVMDVYMKIKAEVPKIRRQLKEEIYEAP